MADEHKLTADKYAARKRQAQARKIMAAQSPKAANDICKFIEPIINLSATKKPIIALYNAIGSELKLNAFATQLRQENIKLCLPVVVQKNAPLIFREWLTDWKMSHDEFNILAPTTAHKQVTPDVIFVPLLAFDRHGYRLGYGGGFYDRTLAKFGKNVISIGVGFAAQQVNQMPRGEFDRAVDYLLTEQEFIQIDQS